MRVMVLDAAKLCVRRTVLTRAMGVQCELPRTPFRACELWATATGLLDSVDMWFPAGAGVAQRNRRCPVPFDCVCSTWDTEAS